MAALLQWRVGIYRDKRVKQRRGAGDAQIGQYLAADVDRHAVAVLALGDEQTEAGRIGGIGNGDVVARHVEEAQFERHLAVEKFVLGADLISRVLPLRRRRRLLGGMKQNSGACAEFQLNRVRPFGPRDDWLSGCLSPVAK